MIGGLVGLFLLTIVLFATLGTQPVTPPTPGASGQPGIGDTTAGGQGQDVDGIKCEAGEQLTYHVHAHLYILVDGKPEQVWQQIGIPGGGGLFPKCFYWLHTHDTTGVIHIEAPSPRVFTLGEFFDIWGEPLNRSDVANFAVPGDQLTVFVGGKQYSGDPTGIELASHTQVVIEIGTVVQPPPFVFPPGY